MSPKLPGSKVKLLLSGAAAGLAYGLLVRASAQFLHGPFLPIMTVALLFLLPFAMGFLSVFLVERREVQPVWVWLLLPLVPFAGGIAASMLALWEGVICVVMFAPVEIGLAVIGGVAGGLIARHLKRARSANLALASVMILPLLVSPWEQRVLVELRRIETVTDIQAPPAVVWSNIERVPRIRNDELLPSWSRHIGFPCPVEATLSFEGLGVVRHASFQGGVLFIETIDTWDPHVAWHSPFMPRPHRSRKPPWMNM